VCDFSVEHVGDKELARVVGFPDRTAFLRGYFRVGGYSTGIQNSALNGSMIARRLCESSSIPGDMPVFRDH
jgi:hypothetical protein